MIRDTDFWNRWEEDYQRNTPVNVAQNFRLMEAMYQEARQFGYFPPSDPLEGLEADILYAKAINVPSPSRPAI